MPDPAVDDPADEAVPWAMQLVLHIEKTDQPSRAALCQAAAVACVTLLADARALPGGPWHEPITHWTDRRIRKHARRARGAAWTRVQALDGVTAQSEGAEVRAFVPCSTAEIPRDIDKLQLSGSELSELGPVDLEPSIDGPLVVAITAEPAIGLGKAAAAAAHAAQLAARHMAPDRLARWAAQGFPVLVEHPDVAGWRRRLDEADVVVRDGGFTEVAPGTVTSLARWR